LNGLHIPWCGVLAGTAFRPEAVLVADLAVSEERTRPLPAEDAGVVILNCFGDDEPLYGQFQQLAEALGVDHARCDSPGAFRNELRARRCRLVVAVGHGSQDRFLGKLTLQFGGQWHGAEEVWKDITLPCASVVASLTCYGGGGHSGATSDFGSVASLALQAGARAAITSRWPAWFSAETAELYCELFAALVHLAPQGDTWRLAEVVMRFVYAMRVQGLWNSLGWGLQVPARRDPLR
jgi:hypothetical protein